MNSPTTRGLLGRAAAGGALVAGLIGGSAGVASAAAGPAALGFDRAQYAYGRVSIGTTHEHTFTVRNTGGRATRGLTTSLTGSSTFTLVGDSCAGRTLGPRKTCTVTVRFSPGAVSAVSGTLSVTGKNHSTTSRVALSGAGRGFGEGGDSIYWAIADGTINTGSLAGEAGAVLVSPRTYPNQNDPNQLVVMDNVIYWADTAQGTINSVPVYGGDDNITTLYSGQKQPTGVAISGRGIYWTNTGDGTINTGPLDGGTPSTLVSGQKQPKGLTVSGTSLYWANYGDGTINVGPLTGGDRPYSSPGRPSRTGSPSTARTSTGPRGTGCKVARCNKEASIRPR